LYRVAFSPDGKRLLTVNGNGQNAWDLATRQSLPDATQAVPPRSKSARSPDGRFLALLEGDSIFLHDLKAPVDPDELAFREAMARPDPFWQRDQADRREQERQWFAAAFHLGQALLSWPDDAALLRRRGQALAEQGLWQDARDNFARAVERTPNDSEAWDGLAVTELVLGHEDRYRQGCDQLLQRFGQPPQTAAAALLGAAPGDAWGAAARGWLLTKTLPNLAASRAALFRTGTLRPGVAEPQRLLPFADADPLLRGTVLCRAGRFDEALQALAGRTDGVSLVWRALAEQGRGRPDAARQALEQTDQWLKAPSPDDPRQTNAALLNWFERQECDLLRKEVEALLQSPKP
jgi:tetratricopeptide (TPR) repeat protein